MSQISRGIFAAIAVSLTFGAVPFACGRDLIGQRPNAMLDTAGSAVSTTVNRAAKADRAAAVQRVGNANADDLVAARGSFRHLGAHPHPGRRKRTVPARPAPSLIKPGERGAAPWPASRWSAS